MPYIFEVSGSKKRLKHRVAITAGNRNLKLRAPVRGYIGIDLMATRGKLVPQTACATLGHWVSHDTAEQSQLLVGIWPQSSLLEGSSAEIRNRQIFMAF